MVQQGKGNNDLLCKHKTDVVQGFSCRILEFALLQALQLCFTTERSNDLLIYNFLMLDITKMLFCFPSSVTDKAEVVDHFRKLHPEMKDLPLAIIKIKVIYNRKRRQRIANTVQQGKSNDDLLCKHKIDLVQCVICFVRKIII